MIDRTPQPCLHKIANHQHGTRACYALDRCRCIPCKDANRAAERDRMKAHLYGRWNGYVPADAARAHVRSLQAQGMGWKRVARSASLAESVVWKLIYGHPSRNLAPSKRIRPATEAAILSVRCDLADGSIIDGTGTTRRVQALVAVGWSQSKIAARLGILPGNFTALVHGRSAVTVRTARAVVALYDELWDTLPSRDGRRDKIAYSRSVNYASAHGWLPPLAWDDDSLDNPDASPVDTTEALDVVDELAVERAMSGDRVTLTNTESVEALRRLVIAGASDADCAMRLHVTARTILRWRQAYGIESRWAA